MKKKCPGPIGAHVRVRPDAPPGSAEIIESFLRNGLEAYLCDNDQDRMRLWGILTDVYKYRIPKVTESDALINCLIDRLVYFQLIDRLVVSDWCLYFVLHRVDFNIIDLKAWLNVTRILMNGFWYNYSPQLMNQYYDDDILKYYYIFIVSH